MLQQVGDVLDHIREALENEKIPILKLLSRTTLKAYLYNQHSLDLDSSQMSFVTVKYPSIRFERYVAVLKELETGLQENSVSKKR